MLGLGISYRCAVSWPLPCQYASACKMSYPQAAGSCGQVRAQYVEDRRLVRRIPAGFALPACDACARAHRSRYCARAHCCSSGTHAAGAVSSRSSPLGRPWWILACQSWLRGRGLSVCPGHPWQVSKGEGRRLRPEGSGHKGNPFKFMQVGTASSENKCDVAIGIGRIECFALVLDEALAHTHPLAHAHALASARPPSTTLVGGALTQVCLGSNVTTAHP